jgi:DNA polymerase-3 subunit epsilon
LFAAIAADLHKMLAGSIFVAHNVGFDYAFLQQEFMRLGLAFAPDRLCTVKLSRALYPHHKSHRLQDLIARYGLQVAARHRAYDDAHALWQFMQHVHSTFEPMTIEKAFAKQLRGLLPTTA